MRISMHMLHRRAKCQFSDIFSLKPVILKQGWYQSPLPEVKMIVAVDNTHLWLAGVVYETPHYDASAQAGSFVEGLAWGNDCLELFMVDAHSAHYQEFHVAPSGAWWTCMFDGIRKPAQIQKTPKHAETFAKIESGVWQAALCIPLSELAITVAPESQVYLNLTAVISSAEESTIRYLSYAPLNSKTPDFHRPEDFLKE